MPPVRLQNTCRRRPPCRRADKRPPSG
jgi:hypothetical protein